MNATPVLLDKPVYVQSRNGSNIQFILVHPVDGSQFEFHVVDGQGQINDAHVLRCLIDHPLRNGPQAGGGFTIIGENRELEIIYEKAMGKAMKRDPMDEKNAELADMKIALDKANDQIKKLTKPKAGDKPVTAKA